VRDHRYMSHDGSGSQSGGYESGFEKMADGRTPPNYIALAAEFAQLKAAHDKAKAQHAQDAQENAAKLEEMQATIDKYKNRATRQSSTIDALRANNTPAKTNAHASPYTKYTVAKDNKTTELANHLQRIKNIGDDTYKTLEFLHTTLHNASLGGALILAAEYTVMRPDGSYAVEFGDGDNQIITEQELVCAQVSDDKNARFKSHSSIAGTAEKLSFKRANFYNFISDKLSGDSSLAATSVDQFWDALIYQSITIVDHLEQLSNSSSSVLKLNLLLVKDNILAVHFILARLNQSLPAISAAAQANARKAVYMAVQFDKVQYDPHELVDMATRMSKALANYGQIVSDEQARALIAKNSDLALEMQTSLERAQHATVNPRQYYFYAELLTTLATSSTVVPIIDKLQQHSQHLQSLQETSTTSSAFRASEEKMQLRSTDRSCYLCGDPNHFAKDCPYASEFDELRRSIATRKSQTSTAGG